MVHSVGCQEAYNEALRLVEYLEFVRPLIHFMVPICCYEGHKYGESSHYLLSACPHGAARQESLTSSRSSGKDARILRMLRRPFRYHQSYFPVSQFANAVSGRTQMPTVTDASGLLILQRNSHEMTKNILSRVLESGITDYPRGISSRQTRSAHCCQNAKLNRTGMDTRADVK